MKTNISNRDWELLSEYIDQQLSPGKQSKLEMRIQQEPQLRAALDDLRRTRYILRSAPLKKAPRNFTLKPHMVPQKKPRRVYPFFQLASAMAAALLLLVFVGEFINPGLGSPVALQAHQSEAVPAAAPDAMEALEAFVLEEKAKAESRDLAPGPAAQSPPEEGVGAPSVAGVPESDIPPSEPPAGEMRLFAEPEVLDPEAAAVQTAPSEEIDTAAQEGTFMGLTLWRLLQVSLAVIAVGTGLAALYFRRIA
jgi:anti-sigma-K factor RskA